LRKDKYQLEGHGGIKVTVGTLLYKVMLSEAQLDTSSTSFNTLRKAIRHPETLMSVHNGNIREWGQKLLEHKLALESRGENMHHMLHILWEACERINNKTFNEWFNRKKDEVVEAKKVHTGPEFLQMMINKYDEMVESGTWDKLDKEAENILALKAQVTDLSKKLASTSKGGDNQSKGGGGKGNRKGKGSDWKRKSQEVQKADDGRSMKYWEEKWMYRKPGPGEPTTKQAKVKTGKMKTWHYCPKHKKWTVHSPEACNYDPGVDKQGEGSNKKMKLSKALAATVQQQEEQE